MGWKVAYGAVPDLGPGLLGGLVIAALIAVVRRRRVRASGRPPHPDWPASPSTDIINAARIKVAGVGGLGLVAMAAAVAFGVPRIGQTVALGLILGVALAAGMILRRRGTGSMPSSGRRMGANTTLSIDAAGEPLRRDRSGSTDHRRDPALPETSPRDDSPLRSGTGWQTI